MTTKPIDWNKYCRMLHNRIISDIKDIAEYVKSEYNITDEKELDKIIATIVKRETAQMSKISEIFAIKTSKKEE
jgi:hypothetical protein